MNEHQLYIKLVAFLGNKAEGIIEAARSNLKTSYGITDGESQQHGKWWEAAGKSAFIQVLFMGLVACIFISAWRIVSTILQGESFYFLALAFATVIAETINEAVMVFRFALTEETTTEHKEHKKFSFHYFSVMGVFRLISRLLFGRELPILQYLLVYLILVGVAFNLDYELGLTGFAAKGFHILYAMLPIVGIGILSHYLGVNLREAKLKDARQNLDFDKLWQQEKLNWLLDTLEAKAANGVGYAAKTLEYYASLVYGSESSAISDSSISVQPSEQAGFARLASINSGKPMERTNTAEQTRTFRTNEIETARRVMEAYPDVLIDDRGWHGRISEVTGLKRGSPTTRVYEAMKYLDQNKE